MLRVLNGDYPLPVGLALIFGSLAFVPVAGAQETGGELTECETTLEFAPPEQFTEVENCPSQTGSSTSTQIFTFVNDLRTRIAQQRKVRRALKSQDEENVARGRALGGAASADDEATGVSAYGRLSPFVVADYADYDREKTSSGQAYDQDTESLILGADYRVDDSLFIGGTLNYLNGDTEFANDSGSIDVDAYILGLHGSKYWRSNLFMDALATYGRLESDIVRRDGFDRRFTASPDGDEASVEVAVGYEYSEGRTRLTPLAKLHYFDGSLDGYSEFDESGSGTPQSFEKQDFDSVNLQLSLQADTVMLTQWGVLIPSVNVAYHHEFSEANTVNGQQDFGFFTQPISQKTDDPDQNYFVVRLGASAQFTHGWSAFASFEKLLHHDYLDRNNAVLGVRYEIF